MFFTRCPFCHRRVFKPFYAAHRAVHMRPLTDGQMKDHITVAPADRHAGTLAGVPRRYRHAACGGVTVMPEEIVRSYLANPFLYNGKTFCCGCKQYVNCAELAWVETGQNMADYNDRLRADYLRAHGKPPVLVQV